MNCSVGVWRSADEGRIRYAGRSVTLSLMNRRAAFKSLLRTVLIQGRYVTSPSDSVAMIFKLAEQHR